MPLEIEMENYPFQFYAHFYARFFFMDPNANVSLGRNAENALRYKDGENTKKTEKQIETRANEMKRSGVLGGSK